MFSGVAAGTNPCNEDSDGDGLPDGVDPTPTEPGATTGFLEDFSRATADEIQALDSGLFNGLNNNANNGRRNALAVRKGLLRADCGERAGTAGPDAYS